MRPLPDSFRPDCAACRGLCCDLPAFDADQGFGYDKPAATPCRHLQADFRCGIHARLAEAGFPGCLRFDCHGAGQRATAESLARPEAGTSAAADREWLAHRYQHLLPLHELQALIHYTLGQLAADQEGSPLRHRLAEIETLCAPGASRTPEIPLRQLRADTLAMLRTFLPTPDRLA